jgi:CRP-like cAMP-binding protein
VAQAENHLIEQLPRLDRKRLLAACMPFELSLSAVLSERGVTARHAYFPVDGFVSLVTRVADQPGLEVGMVGREGMLGAHLALHVDISPLHGVVQGSGKAWRIDAVALRRELARSTALRKSIDRYIYVLMMQLATSAACLRFHMIGPRLARWLLMSQDRAHADQFNITHEFLAYMLGVRRVGITVAASNLQRQGYIEYRRGHLTVLDRRGLESAACSCYATDRQAYSDLL